MNCNLLTDNLTNPALLFFVLSIIAVYLKSDLEIPANLVATKGKCEFHHDFRRIFRVE